jgi:glycosyltransferase involved in cell wall biosynthesis
VTQKLNIKEFVKFQLYRFADRVVPNAFSQESYIKTRFSFLANKVQTISNFVDTNRFQCTPVADVKPQKTLNILVVARVNPQKNVLRFIDAVDILKRKGLDFHVSWFGQKSEDYYHQCISKIDCLGVGSYITFHAATKDINKIYSDVKYDLFCLPSLFEGCPNTIAEAMSSGLPILCSNVCDNAIYVENEVNGFCFNPHDPQNIAQVIINFANVDCEQRLQMRRQSRQRAVALFSEASFLKRYLDIL